jgi:outer membrane immunogenic protein
MKRLLSLTSVLFLTALPLLAGPESLPSGKEMKNVVQPVVQENCNWTGFYIGAHIGYGRGDMRWTDADGEGANVQMNGPETLIVDRDQAGVFTGGQLGYNYQLGHFVFGLEGEFSYSEVNAHRYTKLDDEANAFDVQNDWNATIAGRLGFAWNRFLIYAKGGATFVPERYSWRHGDSFDVEQVDTFHADETRTAALVGGGIEYMINCNWSAKIEYQHLFLEKDDIEGTTIDDGIPEAEKYKVDLGFDSLQVGLNYKFSSFGANHSPSVAMANAPASFALTRVERMDSKDYKSGPAPMPMAEECNWTGFYVGGHVGYAWGDLTWTDADSLGAEAGEPIGPEELNEHKYHGFLTGGELGYNYQIGHFVLGAEGEMSYSGIRGEDDKGLKDRANIFESRSDWTGTIGGRAGFAFHHFLPYAKGGVAFSHFNYSWKHSDSEGKGTIIVEPFNADEVRTAPMVAGGVEYMINCHWSAKVEYQHLFLGDDDVSGTRIDDGIAEKETFQFDLDQDSVRVGLNYRF